MKERPKGNLESPLPAGPIERIVGIVAIIAALTFAVLLGVRPMENEDLGYHLAFGEHFLDTGRIVDSSEYIYTIPHDRQMSTGPGEWYTDRSQYRFVNANWGTQIVMAAVHRLAGMAGLSVLAAGLVAATFLLALVILRRLGIGLIGAAGCLVLIAMASYERFALRPELFTYVLLLGQLYVLLPAADRRASLSTWRIALLCVLQVLLVNVHSYFLLGLALTGVILADRALRLAWFAIQGRRADEDSGCIRRVCIRLAITLGLQVGLCMLNPWTWQLAIMPVQMFFYLRTHHITSPIPGQPAHPMSFIGEFYPTFLPGAWIGLKASWAIVVVLVVAGAGALAGLLLRRWAWVMLIGVMVALSLSMRRNITIASMVLLPISTACLYDFLAPLARRLSAALRRVAVVSAGAAIIVAAGWLGVSVITHRFYFAERRPTRFGVGISSLRIPLDAAGWINRHNPVGRVWCDYNCSSGVRYFTRPHCDVPIITNTWAYPNDVMAEVLDNSIGKIDFDETRRKYGIQTVVLRVDEYSAPLARRLVGDSDWALVHLDARHALFLWRPGPNGPLARKYSLEPSMFDVARYIDVVRQQDSVPAYAFHTAGITLQRLGWDTQATELFRAAINEDPQYFQAWFAMGFSYALRSQECRANSKRYSVGLADLQKAIHCMDKCLEIKPDYEPAVELRQVIRKDIQFLRMLGG
jgi:hypothetical protein